MNDRKHTEKEPEKENMKLTLGFWTTLCVCCMAVMLYFAANKTIVIADVYQEQTETPIDAVPEGHGRQDAELTLKQLYGTDGSFVIPLPKDVKAENVVIENRYMDRQLWIYIQSAEISFYGENGITGDVLSIQSGCCEVQENGILLKLQMESVQEYRSTMEGNTLTIACYEPHELYDYIVVLDPEGGGSDTGCVGQNLAEKDLTLRVAKLVQKKMANDSVRLYLTRAEDSTVTEEARRQLTQEVDADFYICLGAELDEENAENYGIRGSYNEEYYFPDFGNVNLADVVTKEVTISTSNRAAGLFAAEEDSILGMLKTRGMRLSMGYLSNPKEEALLMQDAYMEKLADGIVKAIRNTCDILQGLRNE